MLHSVIRSSRKILGQKCYVCFEDDWKIQYVQERLEMEWLVTFLQTLWTKQASSYYIFRGNERNKISYEEIILEVK